jgi:hypothetical protein
MTLTHDDPSGQSDLVGGVQLPPSPDSKPSASRLIESLIAETKNAFPHVFEPLHKSARSPFSGKTNLAALITEFELLRSASPQRNRIAIFVTGLVQKRFQFEAGTTRTSLEENLAQPSSPLPIVTEEYRDAEKPPLMPVLYPERRLRSPEEIPDILARLLDQGLITTEADQALRWSFDRIRDPGWTRNNLAGKKFVLLGGLAELSPIAHLLSAGADVLTTHSSLDRLHQKLASEAGSGALSGRLSYVPGGVDLLTAPASFAETIITTFAQGKKVHIGAFAYKGGQGREWRLGAAMHGIIRKVRAANLLNSVTWYLSPSITTRISAETARVSRDRLHREYTTAWRLLNLVTGDAFLQPNILERDHTFLTRSLLPYQGASYIAANLFEKIYAAEACCVDSENAPSDPIRISANVAPITRTSSTNLPAMRAVLQQASHFGIQVFEPATTRTFMYLLMVHDLFNSPDPCLSLFARQIHGGVFTNPWALDSVIRMAFLRTLVHRRRNAPDSNSDPV